MLNIDSVKEEKKVYTINEEEYQELDDDTDVVNASTSSSNSSDSKDPTLSESIELKNINLRINKGEFICIIGEVGAGKSSLLSAILGDMQHLSEETIEQYQESILDQDLRHKLHEISEKEESKVKLGGSISYSQQVPWIQNKTIRENILFEEELEEEKYHKTIQI